MFTLISPILHRETDFYGLRMQIDHDPSRARNDAVNICFVQLLGEEILSFPRGKCGNAKWLSFRRRLTRLPTHCRARKAGANHSRRRQIAAESRRDARYGISRRPEGTFVSEFGFTTISSHVSSVPSSERAYRATVIAIEVTRRPSLNVFF